MAAVSLKSRPVDSPSVLQQSPKAATPNRRRKGLLLWLALGMVLVYFAPSLVAVAPLRNVPLRMVFDGIDGTIQSGGASLGWFSPVEYRDVQVYDREGSLLVSVPSVTMDRTALQLLFDRSRLGTVTLEQPEVTLVARDGGSNAEDVLLPWWNTPSSGPIELELDVVDGTIHLHEALTRKEWTIASLAVSLQLSLGDAAPLSWSAKGRINDSGRSGMFSVASAPDSDGAVGLKAEQVPLAMFGWLARRANEDLNLAGELACELVWQPDSASVARQSLRGQVGVTRLLVSGGPLQGDSLALADLMVTGDLQLDGQRAKVKELIVDCELGRASAQGEFATAVPRNRQALEAFLHEKFTLQGTLDLARLSQMLPNTLRVRKDTQINDGTVSLRLSSEPSSGEHHWQARLETSGLAATSAGRPVRWEKPITIELAARESQAGVTVDSLAGSSDFMQLTGKGTPADLSADLAFDLDRLKASVGQLFDLGETRLAGEGRAQLHWQRDDNGAFLATAAAHLKNFQLGANATAVWREEDLTAELTAAGQMTASAVDRLDRAVVRVIAAGKGGASDQLELHLREPVATRGRADGIDRLPMLVHLSGNVNQWQSRLAPWIDLRSWNLAGTIDAHADATWTPAMYELHSLQGSIRQLQATNGTWFIDEPEAQFTAAGRYDAATQRVELVKTTIESSTASIKCDQASIAFSPAGSVRVLGQVDVVADMQKLQRWTYDAKHPAAIAWSGQLRGRTDLGFGGDRTSFQIDAIIDNLAAHSATAAPGNSGSPNPLRGSPAGATANRPALWQEKQLSLAGKASYSQASDGLQLENLQIASDALSFQAAGEIQALAGTADLNLKGQAECDWSRLSKLLAPYLGDSVRLEGRENREFAVRGSIRALMDGGAASPPAVAAGQQADPFIWIKPLSAQASVGWQRAEAYGLRIGQGEIVGNLRDGLVKIDPIELAVSEGRVRLAPQVLLAPAPAELIHGKAKVIDRVQVTPQMTATWLKYIAPAVADATETRGELSLDLTGAKVPLFNPETSSAVGRLDVHTLEVTPGPPARAVILLAEQIRSLVEKRPPPAELSRNPTLLRISDQGIDFRMAGGRVVHQGMTMNIGDVAIRTSGWVAFDETIGLIAEIPIKAEWVQGTPALASMKGQSLQIPIGGTLRRPQIDPRAWQQVLALFAQSAARGVIEDQLNKQLDRLFQPR